MERRIGWSATTVSISAGIVLAIYQVMGWKMSVLVANILIAITSLAGFIVVIVLCHAIWIWSRPIRKRYALRSPIYRQDKPNPHQSLIDISEKQKHNPITHLVVTDRIWFDFKRDAKRPYLRLRIYYANLGINELKVSRPEGYASYKSEQLPDYIKRVEEYNIVPAGGTGELDFNVYIPSQVVQDVCTELDSPTGELRNLGLQNMNAEVYLKGDDTRSIKWNLGRGRVIFRRNG